MKKEDLKVGDIVNCIMYGGVIYTAEVINMEPFCHTDKFDRVEVRPITWKNVTHGVDRLIPVVSVLRKVSKLEKALK